MPFGNATISFVAVTKSGAANDLGHQTKTEVPTTAAGCRHRTLSLKETVEVGFEIGTKIWKSTIPVGEYAAIIQAAVVAIKANEVIRVNGVSYQVIAGAREHSDLDSTPFKVTILSKEIHG